MELKQVPKETSAAKGLENIPICADLDDDCREVIDHIACWLYDMGRGRCPFCSSGCK